MTHPAAVGDVTAMAVAALCVRKAGDRWRVRIPMARWARLANGYLARLLERVKDAALRAAGLGAVARRLGERLRREVHGISSGRGRLAGDPGELADKHGQAKAVAID